MNNQRPLEGLSLKLLKEALINTRQHEAFLSILLVSLEFLSSVEFRFHCTGLDKFETNLFYLFWPSVYT